MHPAQVEQLAAALHQAAVRFTALLRWCGTTTTALREIVNGAVATGPGATHAGNAVLYPDGTISPTTPTAELVARLDQAQATLGEGPCVDAVQARPQSDSPRDRTGVAAAGARGEPGRDPNSNTRGDRGDRGDRKEQGGRAGRWSTTRTSLTPTVSAGRASPTKRYAPGWWTVATAPQSQGRRSTGP